MSAVLRVPPRRERDIQTAILALLHARGVVCWKAGSGGFRVQEPGKRERYVKMGHTGVADIIGLLPPTGRFVAIEVKRPGCEPTQEQAAFLFGVMQAGGLAFVAHSVDEVAQALGWTRGRRDGRGPMAEAPDVAAKLAGRRVVASISGGKDSAAMSLWLTEQGIEHARVFADTGWEHDETYAYLRGPLAAALGPITEVRGPRSMPELIRHKGMFPSRLVRFCTQELKVKPLLAYFRTLPDSHDWVNAIGIRAAESPARAALSEWEWSDAFDLELWRPLLRWTEADVIAIHARHTLAPNPLYLNGARRVGCWPCIFAAKDERRLLAQIDPGRVDEIEALENEIDAARTARFAARGEVQPYPSTFFTLRPDGKTHETTPIRKVMEWATSDAGGQLRLLDTSADEGCMRWGLCEPPEDDPKAGPPDG